MILCQVFPTSLKGATLTWYRGLPHQSIDSFDTLVECFNSQYATSQLHCLTSTAKASLHQVDDEPLRKFIDKFGQIAVQIRNLNPEVVLHSMLLVLRPEAFNAEIPIQLPPTPHPRLGLNITKHCKYPHNHDHNTEDCWTLKDKIEELTHVGYPTQFVKKLDDNRTRGKYEGHHEDYPKHKC
ncbi:hypothetical protein JHK82_044797 [Glycine max]|nr:hypothetical protein JHK82_044797 [Glycine max]